MSGSTFKILKQCIHCGNMFEAQKVTTAYCSHKCNSAHYKLKKKLERKGIAESTTKDCPMANFKPKVSALNKVLIKEKEFLSVKEVAALFNCSAKTVYSLIKCKKIPATNLAERMTIIKRSTIDKLFE